jgi:hypothetical protein
LADGKGDAELSEACRILYMKRGRAEVKKSGKI